MTSLLLSQYSNMKSLKLTPPTALPPHSHSYHTSNSPIQPTPHISITHFNQSSLEDPFPSSDPLIILQLNIQQLEDTKKRLTQQISTYESEIHQYIHKLVDFQNTKKQRDMYKEQGQHYLNKFNSEREETMRLQSIIRELEEAIEREAKERSIATARQRTTNRQNYEASNKTKTPDDIIGSKYINEMYQNMIKYFQVLQEKSISNYEKQISQLVVKIDQLTIQNKQFKNYIKTSSSSTSTRQQEYSELMGKCQAMMSNEKMFSNNCKNSGCTKRNIYFIRVINYAIELVGYKKQIEQVRKQYKSFIDQFNKNNTEISKLKIQTANKVTKMRSRSKSRDNSKNKRDKSVSTNKHK